MAPHIITLPPRIFLPQGRSSLRTSHSGVCRHMYGHLFSAAWILIHRWSRLASRFAGSSPLLCCTIEPLQVDADVSVLRQSKDVWRVSRLHGDGFWLSVPIFAGDLGHLMLFFLRSGPVSLVKYTDVAIFGCWCIRAVLQILTLQWRHLKAMVFNVIIFYILMT
jgi:hypothetical protein